MKARYSLLVAAFAALLVGTAFGSARADQLDERRQQMIEDCVENHGIDCEREVDTELRAEGLQFGARVIRIKAPS